MMKIKLIITLFALIATTLLSAQPIAGSNQEGDVLSQSDISIDQKLNLILDSYFQDVNWKNFIDNGSLEILLEGNIFSSQLERAQYGQFKGVFNTYHNFSPRLRMDVGLALRFTEGVYQYFSPLNRGLQSGIYLENLYIHWMAVKNSLSVKVGVINQSELDAPILVSDTGFLGIVQEFNFSIPFLSSYIGQTRVMFQQAIPSGEIELNRFEVLRDIPGFFTASIFANNSFHLKKIDKTVSFKVNATAFAFKDLPADAATIGRIYSNSVQENYFGSDAEFKYPFFGAYSKASLQFPIFSNIKLEAQASFLWNLGVSAVEIPADKYSFAGALATGRDKAQTFSLGLHIDAGPYFTLIPNVEYFTHQPDASPAKYNSRRYIHSNSTGFIIGLKAHLKKYKLEVNIDYAVIENILKVHTNSNINYLTISIGNQV